MSYDSWKTNPPEPREDAVMVCGDCGWKQYFRYREDAPIDCPTCGGSPAEGDLDEYDDDLEADAADRAYDEARERDWDW